MSITRACADLARIEQSLGIIKQQKAEMLRRVQDDMDDLRTALDRQKDADSPTWVKFSDTGDAIRAAVHDYTADTVSELEQLREDLVERIHDECERRGLDDWIVRNALANAAIHREALRDMLRRARTCTGWSRDDLLNSSASPLYAFRHTWRAYRDWMAQSFTRTRKRQAA